MATAGRLLVTEVPPPFMITVAKVNPLALSTAAPTSVVAATLVHAGLPLVIVRVLTIVVLGPSLPVAAVTALTIVVPSLTWSAETARTIVVLLPSLPCPAVVTPLRRIIGRPRPIPDAFTGLDEHPPGGRTLNPITTGVR